MTFIAETALDVPGARFAGGEASFGDVFDAVRDEMLFISNSTAREEAWERAIDDRIEQVRAATGIELDNPALQVDQERRGFARRFEPMPRDPQWRWKRFQHYAGEMEARISELARQRPDAAEALRAHVPLEQDVRDLVQRTEERSGLVTSSRSDVVGKWGAILSGGFAGGIRDPLMVLSLFAGGGPGAARTVGSRVLSVALKEAAVNAGFEALNQPNVQAWRKQNGLDHGFSRAAADVALAAVLGGAVGTVFQGASEAIGAGVRASRARAQFDAAQHALPEYSPLARVDDLQFIDAANLARPVREMLPAEARGAVDAAELDEVTSSHALAGVDAEAMDELAGKAAAWAEDPESVSLVEDVREILRESSRPERPEGTRPQSLSQFLVDQGGIRSDRTSGAAGSGGDLEAAGVSRIGVAGKGNLVRINEGMTLDEARIRAAEAGYFSEFGSPERAIAQTTDDDLISLLRDEAAGNRRFAQGDAERVQAFADFDRAVSRTEQQLDRTLADLDEALTDDMPVDLKHRAAELMLEKDMDGVDAIEQAKNARTGRVFSGVTHINGSTVDPAMVFANAGPDSLVIFNGQISPADTFAFNNGQVALGGQGRLEVFGCDTRAQAMLRIPGPRATVTGWPCSCTAFPNWPSRGATRCSRSSTRATPCGHPISAATGSRRHRSVSATTASTI